MILLSILLTAPVILVVYAIVLSSFLSMWKESTFSSHWQSILGSLLLGLCEFGVSYAIGGGLANALVVIAINIVAIRLIYINEIRGPKPLPPEIASQKKKRVFVVTGSNQGIGYNTVKQILTLVPNSYIIMACRSAKSAEKAIEKLAKTAADKEGTRSRLKFIPLDLSSYDSIHEFANKLGEEEITIDVLILNAGMMSSTKSRTVNGNEMVMGVNHLGGFLLTHMLMPFFDTVSESKCEIERDVRLVVVTSSTHWLVGEEGLSIDDLNCEDRKYGLFSQYAQSKLANILFANEFSRRQLSKNGDKTLGPVIKTYCVHPGMVRTEVTRNMNFFLRWGDKLAAPIMKLLQKTPEAGAYTSVYCAISDAVKNETGGYYVNSTRVRCSPQGCNIEMGKMLWEKSLKLTKIGKR